MLFRILLQTILFVCSKQMIATIENQSGVEKSRDYESLGELFLDLNNMESFNKKYVGILLSQKDTIFDKIQFQNDLEINISCSETINDCTLIFDNESRMLFEKGRIIFNKIYFKYCFNEPSSFNTNLMELRDKAKLELKDCAFGGNFHSNHGSIFDINQSSVIFIECQFDYLVIGNLSIGINAYNESILNFTNTLFKNVKIEEDGFFLTARNSSIQMDDCQFLNFKKLGGGSLTCGFQETSCLSSILNLINTLTIIRNISLVQVILENCYFIHVKNSLSHLANRFRNITIENTSVINGSFASVSSTVAFTEFSLLNIVLSQFVDSSLFVLEDVGANEFLLMNSTLTNSKIYIFVHASQVESFSITNIHLSSDFWLMGNLTTQVAEAFLYADSFSLANINNVTIRNFTKIQPAFILKNSKSLHNSTFLLSKCSFINTDTEGLPPDKLSLLGNNYGGVLSFKKITSIYINETLFKDNEVNDIWSTTGSVGIYCESTNYGSLSISNSVFMNNKIITGPYLITYSGYYFYINNLFIINTSYIGSGGSGLSMIRVEGSIIKIDTLFCFSNSITDGLFYVLEKNLLNRVHVTNLIACNNSALKRGGASFIFDGSSRNREVLLTNSTFVANSANTQSAAGFHIFHSSLFERLNLTYDRCRFYHNIASLGTSWWIRLAKKGAVFSISDCEFQSSLTYLRPSDWAVAYAIGAEKGSWLLVRNCVMNKSTSRTYGFYIKDLQAVFVNVTLIDQNVLNQHSTLFRVEGIGLTLQDCLITNQSSNSIYFNVQDNATLVINGSSLNLIKTENCSFFAISKSLIYVLNTSFVNISVDNLFSIMSSGTQEAANIFKNLTFSEICGTVLKTKYSVVALKFNAFKSIFSNVLSIDSTSIEIIGNSFWNLKALRADSNFIIMKFTASKILMKQIVFSNTSAQYDSQFTLVADSELNITDSNFIDVYSNSENALFSAEASTVNINKCIFISVLTVVLQTVKCSSLLINCIFSYEHTKNFDVTSVIDLKEIKSSNISNNKFMGGSFQKSALYANEIKDANAVLVIINNYFEKVNSSFSKGSCLNMVNINVQILKNIFVENRAYEAGAVYIYCEIRNLRNDISECEWLISNNIFYNNTAETSAGALRWMYVPPKEENNNIFINNTSSNRLEFESFPVRVAAYYKNNTQKILADNVSIILISNHSSGNNLDGIEFNVLDTYGQRSREFYKLSINTVLDEDIENLTSQFQGDESLNLRKYLKENKMMKSLFSQKKSIYSYKPSGLSGKTVILKNNIGIDFASETEERFLLLNTFLIGTPGYYAFLNISSSAFFFNKKNLLNSSIFRYLNENQALLSPNEIRTPTSYSFIVPIGIKTCTSGEHFDDYKNLCEACNPNTLNYLENQTECISCPEGAICLGGNDVRVKKAYWRVSNDSSEVFECNILSESCPGGVASECSENYQGNLCASCKEWADGRFLQKGYSMLCKECPPIFGQIVLTIFMFWLLFEVIWILCYFFFIEELHSGRKRIAIKCLINYFHTFLLQSTYNINTGTSLKIYVACLHNLSLVLTFWFSLECYAGYINIQYRFFVKTALEMSLFHIFLLSLLFFRRKKSSPSERNKIFLEEILFIWYIFYPSILHHVITNSSCRTIGDEKYLFINLDINCKDSLAISYIAFNVAVGSLWIIVAPYKLIKGLELFHQGKITHKKTKNILTLGYDNKFLMIEIKLYIFKCILIIIDASEINEQSKMLLIWPIFFYYLILETQNWYLFKSDFHKEARFMIIINFMVLCYGYLWITLSASSAFEMFLMILAICFQVYFFYFLISYYLNTSFIEILFGKKKSRLGKKEPTKNRLSTLNIGAVKKSIITLFTIPILNLDQSHTPESSNQSSCSSFDINEHKKENPVHIPIFKGEATPPHILRNNLKVEYNAKDNSDVHTPNSLFSNFSEKKKSYFK